MIKATRILAVVGLIGFSMGAKNTLKQKLAERGSNLAQVEVESEAAYAGAPLFGQVATCGCGCPILGNSCDKELKPVACDCTPSNVGNDLPPLGSGDYAPTSLTTILNSQQEQVFQAIPDTQVNAYDESSCCSCENALHQAGANATKVRKFGISGDICVTESIQYYEAGCAEEASAGRSRKNALHQENMGGSGLGSSDNCTDFTLNVCAPGNVTIHNN